MKVGKQLLLPVLLILIFGIYLGVKSTGKINYKLPVFTSLKVNSIKSIEIINDNSTIKLYSDKGVWKFSSDNKRVNLGQIEQITNFLVTPNFTDMVSVNTNYQNFGLENGNFITVRAYNSIENTENPVREFFIGNLSSNRNFTYIRIPDNSNVYTTDSSIKSIFDTTRDKLLDKRISVADSTSIDKIVYSANEINKTFIKAVGENNTDLWNDEGGDPIDSTKLEQSLRYLINSRFESYNSIGTPETGKDLISLILQGKETEESFSIIKKLETGYLGRSTFAGNNFVLSDNTGNQIIKMFNSIIDSE